MARKTTTTTTTRRKKTEVPAAPAVVQVAPEIQKQAPEEARKDASKIGTLLNQTPVNQDPVIVASVNIEEEIRRRAYELYLQRRTTGGGGNGNQNQDWLIAEREIRSRQGVRQLTAAAGRA